MHPQIVQPESGDCPICGMDLIPLAPNSHEDLGPRAMSMSKSSRALAEIQITAVRRKFPEAQIRLVGKLGYDETLEKSLTARFPARIDELYVNFTGISVKKGEHLAKVYSPELLIAQRELLTTYRNHPNSSITRAAREKLRLWDLLPEQIEEIITSGEPRDHFVLRAPLGGVVVSKKIQEGDYVQTGQPLFRIVDLNRLWLNLDAYESDIPWLHYGQKVAFTVEAHPGETFHGQIVFIEPEVDEMTRTVGVRVHVSNPDGRLKPGMFARGVVTAKMAEGGKVFAPELAGKWISPMHPEIVKDAPGQCDVCGMDLVPAEELGYVQETGEKAPLIIPSSAVLRTGKRAIVYVANPDAPRPTYEGREITLGPRAGSFFLVAEGLTEGEQVVTQGAFKIDSALQIHAKPSMMNPGDENGAMMEQKGNEIALSPQLARLIFPQYLDLQKALADDKLEESRQAIRAMHEKIDHDGKLEDLLHLMETAEELDTIRRPHFETLSNALIKTLKEHPETYPNQLYLMHCPMVYGSRGADWLQDSSDLRNPYFGAMMLECGELVKRIGND